MLSRQNNRRQYNCDDQSVLYMITTTFMGKITNCNVTVHMTTVETKGTHKRGETVVESKGQAHLSFRQITIPSSTANPRCFGFILPTLGSNPNCEHTNECGHH